MKKILKILGIILLVFIAAAAVLWCTGTSRQKFKGADAELSSWMAKISDDAALKQRDAIRTRFSRHRASAYCVLLN